MFIMCVMPCLYSDLNCIFVLIITANTEANERRISNVEGCFGASGQVSCDHANV